MNVVEKLGIVGSGGIEAAVFNSTTLIENDEINISYFSDTKTSYDYYDNLVQKMGKEIHYPQYTSSNKLKRIILHLKEFCTYCHNNKIDIVHYHMGSSYSTLINYLFVKKYCKKFIVHSHTTATKNDVSNFFKHSLSMIFKSFLSRKNIIFCACSDIAAESEFPRKVYMKKEYFIIKNGINTEKFIFNSVVRNAIRKELDIANKFVIGHIGRFAYAKNHIFLIDIFNEVYKKNKNAVLLLIGDGEFKSVIQQKVNSLGLADNVIFYGTTDKANELYQAMDCFIFPSRYEGLGIVAIEAQTAGLKTLCADTIPAEAKITDLFEYMSLDDTAENWANKILSYDNGYERIDTSEKIKAAGYDIRESAKKLEEIYLST